MFTYVVCGCRLFWFVCVEVAGVSKEPVTSFLLRLRTTSEDAKWDLVEMTQSSLTEGRFNSDQTRKPCMCIYTHSFVAGMFKCCHVCCMWLQAFRVLSVLKWPSVDVDCVVSTRFHLPFSDIVQSLERKLVTDSVETLDNGASGILSKRHSQARRRVTSTRTKPENLICICILTP